MERRWKAVGKLDETHFPEKMKTNFEKAIITKMMSSDYGTFDTDGKSCFKIKPLLFRTRKYNNLMDLADKIYIETCSRQLKEQFKDKLQGSLSRRPPPKSLEYGYDLFITKT